MTDIPRRVLYVVDTDRVARRNVLYCKEVVDTDTYLGKRFRCVSSPLEVTLDSVGTCGTAALTAFAYSGVRVPPGELLEFHEILER